MTATRDRHLDGSGLIPTARTLRSERHATRYWETGPDNGPLMIFLHGWPGIGLIWRAQMQAFAARGWHCVAPDMRGYGGSSAPKVSEAYTVREIVRDMVELHDHLGGRPAVWVGHDLGSPVAASLTTYYPERSRGLVLVSVPYLPGGFALASLLPLVDQELYPSDTHPDGQWSYYRFYQTHFDQAVADFDADIPATLAAIYRSGDRASRGRIHRSASVTRDGGWFGPTRRAPAILRDPALWPSTDFDTLVAAYRVTGFRPPSNWYLNDDANIHYALAAPYGGRLFQPVLFVNGDFDGICNIGYGRLGEPMRRACADLTVSSQPGGHWLPLERKAGLTRDIDAWLDAHHLALPASQRTNPPPQQGTAMPQPKASSPGQDTRPFASWKADHVAIRVPDLAEAVAWYIDKLDFRLAGTARVGELAFGFVTLAANDDLRIEILAGPATLDRPPYDDLRESLGASGLHHLGIRVDDVDATVGELRRRGVKIIREPGDVPELGLRLAFFSDPWGNILEAIAPIEPSSELAG